MNSEKMKPYLPGVERLGKDAEASFGTKPAHPFRTGLLWLLLFGLPFSALVFMGTRYVIRSKLAPVPVSLAVVDAKTGAVARVRWRGLLPAQIAEKFLAASTQEERLRWVRQPTEVAGLMERYFRDGAGATEKVADIHQVGQDATDFLVFDQFAVTMTDGSDRLLCVPFDESGGKVDFKSYARHCSNPWDEVLDGTVAKASEMRVFLAPENYYNYEYTDDQQWLCLVASSPELEDPIHLYARRDNPELRHFLKNLPIEPQCYVVAIENPGEGHRNRQWQLTRVVAASWVVP